MNPESRIFVAGHRGMVGSALVRRLQSEGFQNLIVVDRGEVDLRDSTKTSAFLADARPEYIFVAASKVGGIWANQTFPADFIYDNLAIAVSVIGGAHRHGVDKLLFLGSSCAYPRATPSPIREEALLSGALEESNEAYAVAKLAGIKLCQSLWKQHSCRFISLMPTNLYGPGDNWDLQTSHVVPALIRRFHEAKVADSRMVQVWGSGRPRREFMHVDDLADACLFLMRHYESPEVINVGTGVETSISDLAQLIKGVVGFRGEIAFDHSMPDGTPRKLLDVSRLAGLGWRAQIPLREGIEATYQWFEANSTGGNIPLRSRHGSGAGEAWEGNPNG